jgi:hypothetical protein
MSEEGPTQEAYDLACAALWKHRAENKRLKSALGLLERREPFEVGDDRTAEFAVELAEADEVILELEAALKRALNWLSSYPGGCAEAAYDQARAALAALNEARKRPR